MAFSACPPFFDHDARPVPHILIGACQFIEEGGLPQLGDCPPGHIHDLIRSTCLFPLAAAGCWSAAAQISVSTWISFASERRMLVISLTLISSGSPKGPPCAITKALRNPHIDNPAAQGARASCRSPPRCFADFQVTNRLFSSFDPFRRCPPFVSVC